MFDDVSKTPMTTLRCVVERIIYQNPENGYSVLKVKVKGYDDLVTLVGNLLEVPVGSVLLCRGEWKVDKRYGSQFVAATWEETMPATVYGIEKYLGSGLVKGIGPRFARAIVQRFGAATIEVIETDIERLYEVPQIGRKRVEKIRESWERQKEIKNVMLFLQSYGVSTAYAAKIYREYGSESIDKVRENPYRLADDIWGIEGEMLERIRSLFKCGWADDAETSAMIREAWRKDGRLVDPHTAVALKVARERADRSVPCVVLSTASPFKFCRDVYIALTGRPLEGDPDGFAYMDALSGLTSENAPAPLAGLRSMPVLHKAVVRPEGMADFIRAAVARAF